MLEVNCKNILLDEVAVNDIPTYRPVRVQSKVDVPLVVTITPSSPLLRFQLRNENHEAIQQVGLRDSLYVYNETFDLVGLISSFELAPREEKEIIVSFRADPAAFSHLLTGAQAAPFNGTVQFTATSSQPVLSSSPAANNVDTAANNGAAQAVSSTSLSQQQVRTVSCTIPFRANVFVSFLKLSPAEIQVTMTPNKTQVADFVVTNTSCQPVLFLIRDQAVPLKGLDIALYEADKFEDPKLGHRILLDSYASMTFSLMVRSSGANPDSQRQYHTVLQCDNLRDNRNTTFIYVNVNVGTELQGDVLAFPDTSIDFGDVYRGTKAFAQIRVQNIGGREDAVVRLADTDRRKYDGKFSLMKGDSQVDELTIAARKGNPFVTITLMYQPSRDIDSKEAAKKKFDVELLAQSTSRAKNQRVVIRCSAILYTSNIVVSQRSVNFGDCQVGQSKRYTFQIENHSPLQGKVVVQLRSKIIQIEGILRTNKTAGRELREEFTIGPSASLPLTLKITPQRVNPLYRKQLTIINVSNPAEDRQVINIEANNMAPLDTNLHDQLYSWKCDLGGNNTNSNNNGSADAVDTRHAPTTLWAISNVPLLIPYSVQSKVNHEVVLKLRSSSPEIEVFYSTDVVVCGRLGEISAELRRLCLYGEGEDSSYLTNKSAEQLFIAREELLKLLSETSRNITNRIILEPNASLKAYALIIRTTCPTEPLTKEDGISIAVDGIDAPRFVRLSYRLCGTTFELNGQKTKNFGEVNIGVKKTTKLPIVNRCNSFLFLHLSKSRSVTAEHIRMEHSDKQSIFLTIRPYASREIELTLYPSIKGMFQEKIHITNILNIQNSITITIKAVVTKADTFEISPDSWVFEMIVPPSPNVAAIMASAPSGNSNHSTEEYTGGSTGGATVVSATPSLRVGAKFTVANTSKSRRQIIARVELSNSNAVSNVSASNPYLAFPGVKVAVQLDMTLTGASSVSTRKLEEQIEKLEQKLKIYVRKKKTEKADNARRKIEAYKLALKGEEVDLTALESSQSNAKGATDHDLSESEDESSTNAQQALKSRTQQNDIAQLLRREGIALPSMGAGESVMITLFLICKRIPDESIPVSQSHTMNILFYEARDQEANRIIPIDMILMRTPGDVFSHKLPAALDTTAASQLLTSVSSATGESDAQRYANSDASSIGTANNPLITHSTRTATGMLSSSRVQQVRPPPSIRLSTTGVLANGSGGHLYSTFMGHPLLVLRNCIVNDPTEFSFLIEADGDTTIVMLEPRRCGGSVTEVLDARFKLFPRNGHVRQQEPLRIVVECIARSVGPQKYFIPVKNIRNAADVHYLTVEMNPTEEIDMLTTEPKELFFRDVLTPCVPSQLEAQVVSIRSRFPFPHALVVRTNKPSLVALFEDASCSIPLVHPIRRVFVKETVRVYVQLRPGARYVDPRARNIHAGVLVEALVPNPSVSSTAFCAIGKAVLRAVARVGGGLVEALQRNLELGCVRPTEHYCKTQFVLRNTSYSFALCIALVPSSPLVEVAEETTHGEEITLAPLEEHAVPIVLHLPAPGLTQEFIDVVNRSSVQEAIRVSLSAMRMNDGILQVEPPLNTPLSFPMAAVVCSENGKELRLHQAVSCSVKMANHHSNREVVLATSAITPTARALPLWFHTSDEEAQVRNALEEEQRQISNAEENETATDTTLIASSTTAATVPRSGITAPTSTPTSYQLPFSTYVKGRVELQANLTEVVMWTLTDLPALTAEEVAAVLQHELVIITSTLQVYVTYTAHSAKTAAVSPRSQHKRYRGPAVGQCVLLVPITLSLSMSEGRAEPAVINLGLVAKPTSPPASPISATAEESSDDVDSTEVEDGTTTSCNNTIDNNEEAVLAARVRRRRRVRLAQLRRPGNHQQFSSYSTKSDLQQSLSRNVTVSFRLVNLSAVMPLRLKVECPPVIHFSQTRFLLPPGATESVDATLNLKLITRQGSFRYEAFFVNEWNPENDMAVCITGQHYWKVLKIVRADTEEELRDAVTLAPLHVEPSLQAPLSELKLAFIATEPDVAFDLHIQPNPKLEGLLELLLLHYDATSAVKHLSFRSDLTAPPAAGATMSTTASGVTGNGAGGASTANNAGVATQNTNAVATTAGGGITGGTLASSSNVNTSPGPLASASSVILSGSRTPLSLSEDITPTGNAGPPASSQTASVTVRGNNNTLASAAVGSGTPSVTASISSIAKHRKVGAGPSGSAGAGNTATVATTRSQQLRLRCVLRSGDLASLVSIFYGARKSRTNAVAARNTNEGVISSTAKASGMESAAAATAAAAATTTNSSSASTVWTYDRIAEVERCSAALVSNNVWLGTVWVANSFTEDEEVQVYGTLCTFRTFSASSKVSLRPSRISVETPLWLAQTDSTSQTPQVGYVGEITIVNEFEVYVADISVAVLVDDRLGVPLEIDVRGGRRAVPSTASGSAPAETTRNDNTSVSEAVSGIATAPNANAPTSASTPISSPDVATSFIAEAAVSGAPPVSQPHCVQLGPRETVVLTIAVRAVSATTTTAAATTPPLSLTSLEQCVSVLIVDDNVPFSYHVSRVNVVTVADGVEGLQRVTLRASVPPTSRSTNAHTTALTATAATPSTAGKTKATGRRLHDSPPPSEAMSHAPTREEALEATAAAGSSPEPPWPHSRRPDSTHTQRSRAACGDGTASLLPSVVAELSAVETTAVETADANYKSVGGGVGASAESAAAVALSPHVSAVEVAAAEYSSLASTTATTVAPSVVTDTSVAAPRNWVLSLKNCDPLPGCSGVYISNFSVSRDDTYDPNILLVNNLPNTTVRYTVQVVSQSPQVWLLLTSTSGVLEGGETQPLRLQVLSSDVGSFVGYVAITNAHDTREVVYLRINAEVFVTGTTEGLFDVIAMNGGHRLATTNAVHNVNMGPLYGSGTTRTLIALEIVNKGNVALEFPVSVVHPMRQELRPIPPSVWYSSAITAAASRRRHPIAVPTATAPPASSAQFKGNTDSSASTPKALSVPPLTLLSTKTQMPMEGTTSTAATAENAPLYYEMPLHNQPAQRGPHPYHHPHHTSHHCGVSRLSGITATSAAATTATAMNASSASPFEGKLVVSHIHNVAMRTAQKYFVVGPHSPLRLAFLLSCTALQNIPDGYSVFGETDVVFKCKQARDAQFTFNVRFEALKPTFAVALEYDMDAAETVAAAAASSARWAETEVAVTNLSRHYAQTFVLFSQSEVLTLAPASATPVTPGMPPDAQQSPSSASFFNDGSATAAVEMTVAPQSVGVFLVRLDRLRAEALLNFDKDESKLARPALCEHAYLYNKGNPRERVQLLFRQQAVSARAQRQGRVDMPTMATATEPLSPTLADAKPVKGSSRQHFSERHILGFAQRFSAVLTSLAEYLPFTSRSEDAADGVAGSGNTSGGVSGGGGGGGTEPGGAKSGAGDYSGVAGGTNLSGSLRAATTTANVLSSVNTPGGPRHRTGGQHGRSGVDDFSTGKGDRRPAALHCSHLDSSADSTSDDSAATTSSSDEDTASDDVTDELGMRTAADDADRTLNSTQTEDSNGVLTRTMREVGEEVTVSCDLDAEGAISRVGGVEVDRRQRQQAPSPFASNARVHSGEGSVEALTFLSGLTSPLSAGAVSSARGSSVMGRSNEEAKWYEAVSTLHNLLVELTWLCDELLFYAILLRNSRHVEACGVFLVSTVSQHPVMVAWRRRRSGSSRARVYDIFGRFLETIEALPRISNTA